MVIGKSRKFCPLLFMLLFITYWSRSRLMDLAFLCFICDIWFKNLIFYKIYRYMYSSYLLFLTICVFFPGSQGHGLNLFIYCPKTHPETYWPSQTNHFTIADPNGIKTKVSLLCRRHTVLNLTPDGNTIMEMFTFGSDHENIGPFVRTSLAIVWSPLDFLGFGSNTKLNPHKSFGQFFGMPKIARRPCEGSISCWIRVSILPFVRPSWGNLVKSCHLWLPFMSKNCPKTLWKFNFVLSSCVHVAVRKAIVRESCQIVSSLTFLRVTIVVIVHYLPHEDNIRETRSCPIILRREHDYAKLSQCRRIAIVLKHDGIEMEPRCLRRQPNLSSSSISHVSQ